MPTELKPFDQPIYVTRPYLPPIGEYFAGLQEIWDNQWLTNNGPVLRRFVAQLGSYLRTDNVCLFANGTLALQLGLQGMEIEGEVITTPFTFVATTHALHLSKLRPVFVDIEPDHYTLDPDRVEAAITPRTSAILAVHVFGYPCRLAALADIARRHNLKLIYDAAHAFGVEVDGRSIGLYGDLSMFSFHATKFYHSIEGGMLTFQDPALKPTFDCLRNFGFRNEVEVVLHGTNAKMNEMQALMGTLVLAHLDEVVEKRRAVEAAYRAGLAGVPGIRIPSPPAGIRYNYGYVPIEVDEAEFGASRDRLHAELKSGNVHARRYFYPLVPDLACYRDVPVRDPLTVARRVAGSILCLPTYDGLAIDSVARICRMISDARGR
jgi:dTDP-4-amino-4,6-dideoxygalactose transaminase